jgi:hypothetical protein
VVFSTNYLQLNNMLDLQEIPQRKKNFKTIKDWSIDVQCSGNTYDGVRIPARESAITVVVLNRGAFFFF